MQSSVPVDVLQGVHNSMTDMVKEVANEPSVGLYFVQQHVHKAVPGLLSLKSQLVEGTQEALSYTEDVKDSLTAVKAMKEVGSPVIKNMIATLNSSLQLLPTLHHPRVGGRSPAGYAHLSRAATHHGDTAFSKMQPENKSTAGVKGSMHEAPGLLSTPRGALDALPPRSPQSSATQAIGVPPAPSNLDSTSYVSSFLNSAYQRASSVRMSMPTTFEVKEGLSLSKENNVSDSKRPLDSSTSQNPTQDSNAGQIANKSYWSVFESAMQKAGSMVGTGAIASTGTASDSSLAPTIPQGSSATTLRESPSITSASHLRAVFDSAVSRAGNAVRREGSSPKSDHILERSVLESAEGQAMRVDWLKLPRPAFRKLNRREETDTTQGSVEQLGTQGQGETEDLEKEDGDNSSKLNLEDPEVLESYAKLQVEQAAKLEAWLGDAKDDEPSPTF